MANSGQRRPISKVCYLNFDGVLHDQEVYWKAKQPVYVQTPGRFLFEWMPILEELLAPYPDVKIILSTSWVHTRSFAFAKKRLSTSLQQRVIGTTFEGWEMQRNYFRSMPQGQQIGVDVFRRALISWFAIESDFRGWSAWCYENLIHTDGSLGISDPAIQTAIRKMLERL